MSILRIYMTNFDSDCLHRLSKANETKVISSVLIFNRFLLLARFKILTTI